jgi:mannose-6-phosphate isomerase
MGKLAPRFRRFPLLLKFLDAREMLSVQVHPSDVYPDLIPAGETGKTEAWVVIEAEKESHIYAGLKPGTTADGLRRSLANGTIADRLVGIVPKPGDAVFIPAGTVHTLGGGCCCLRGSAKQRRHIPPLRLGSCRREDWKAAAASGRSGVCLHRF